MLYIIFQSIQGQKTVSEVLKRGIFFYPAFCSAGQWGGYATDYSTIQALNLVCIVS